MKKIILPFLLILNYCLAFSQAGTLDPSFGSGGVISNQLLTKGNINPEFSRQCFPQADGKMLLVIDAGYGKMSIGRRLANGDRDLSFAHEGYTDFLDVSSPVAAIQTDGKIVVVGSAQNTQDFYAVRFNSDGTLDAGFGTNGITITDAGTDGDFLTSVVVGPDGKIYGGGYIAPNGSYRFALIRYTANGQPDPTFGQNGIVITNFNDYNASIVSVAITPENKIIAFGNVSTPDGGDYALAKYNLDGSPDLTFNGTGQTTIDFGGYDNGTAFAVNSDGKMYIAAVNSYLVEEKFRITRLNADGTLDLTFNNGLGYCYTSFGNVNDILTNMLILPEGKLLIAGSTSPGDYNLYNVAVTRLNNDGTADTNFGTNGLVTSDILGTFDNNIILTRNANGQIIMGGYTDQSTGSFDFTLFRYSADGVPDASFGSGGSFLDFIPSSAFSYNYVFGQQDSKLLVLGASNDGVTKTFLSRFNSNGSVDNTYGQSGVAILPTLLANYSFQPDGKVLAIGSSDGGNGGNFQLWRFNADGTADNGFGNAGTVISDFGGNENPYYGAVQTDGKIVAVGYQYTDIGNQLLVARYNSNGSLDNSFGNSGFTTVVGETETYPSSILVQPDGKILIISHGYLHPPDYSYFYFDIVLVRLNPDGSPDNTFGQSGVWIKDHGPREFAGILALQADNKILYTYFAGQDQFSYYAERLNADGTLDNSFGINGDVNAKGTGVLIQQDQKILLSGGSVGPANSVLATITRLNTDGSPDNSFGTNGNVFQSFSPGDNYVAPIYISGNSMFATGSVFNRIQTGVIAKFQLTNTNGVNCPTNVIKNTDKNTCSAKVSNIDPTFPAGGTIKYKLTGATKGSGNGSASGKVFNKGTTTVTYTLNGDATKTCSFTVIVQDKELPTINNVSVSDATLWPADHKLKDVTVNYTANDNCGIATTQLSVSSNEPVQSGQTGDQSPDWQIIDAHHVKLRAERLDAGTGRMYTITITATDVSGNVNSSTVTVNVPKTKPAAGALTLSATPNPSYTNFMVTVSSTSPDKINLRVIDNNGTVVSAISNISAPQILTIGSNLVPGIYYIEATQGGVSKSIKLVKQ